MTLEDSVRRHGGMVVRIARIFMGYSTNSLASDLGISHSQLSCIETGKRSISTLQRLYRSAKALGLSPDDFGTFALELDANDQGSDLADFYQQLNNQRLPEDAFDYARGDSIRIVRSLLGITQKSICERTSLSDIENMYRVASDNMLTMICSSLDVELDYLNAISVKSDSLNSEENEKQRETFLRLHQRWKRY